MSDLKGITKETIETLRNTPYNYVAAIAQLSLWDKLVDAFHQPDLTKYAKNALLKARVRKNFLKGKSAENVVEILDSVTPSIRRHILNILIERADTEQLPSQVGSYLLENRSKHFWSYYNVREIFSLLPIDQLKTAFKARVEKKPGHEPRFDFNLLFAFLDENNSYDKLTPTSPFQIVTVTLNSFAPIKYLKKRKSIGKVLSELLVQSLDQFQEKNDQDSFLQFVVFPLLDVFLSLKQCWEANKEILKNVHEALLRFPFHLTHTFRLQELLSNHLEGPFQFKSLIKNKLISNNDLLFNIIPKVFKYQFQQPLDKTYFIKPILNSLLYKANVANVNFFNALKSISKDESNQDHPLAFIWPELLRVSEQHFKDRFFNRDTNFLRPLAEMMNADSYNELITLPNRHIIFSYDFAFNIFNTLIRSTIDMKNKIVEESPHKYTFLVTALFESLTLYPNWRNDMNLYFAVARSPLFHFEPKIRDELILQVMCDPTGKKNLSDELTKSQTTSSLTLSLLIDDMKKAVQAVSPEKAKHTDKYGFQNKVSINFQPSLTQKTRDVEEYVGKIHLFERILIPLLRNKHIEIMRNAYNLYWTFVKKILSKSIQINDSEFYKDAIGVHLRYCRFLNSSVSEELLPWVITRFCECVAHPLSIYVGLKSYEDYASYLFENVISKFPYTTNTTNLTMLPILNSLITSSSCELLPGIEDVSAKLLDKVFHRLFNSMPLDMNCPQTFSLTKPLISLLPPQTLKNSIKVLRNAQANLSFSTKLCNKIFKNYISYDSKSLNKTSEAISGLYVDSSLITPELANSFSKDIISLAPQPVLTLINLLKEKIDQYNSDFYLRPTTKLLKLLINYVSQAISLNSSINNNLPLISFPYEKIYSERSFNTALDRFFKYSFPLKPSTYYILQSFLPENSFLFKLLNDSSFDIDKLDQVLTFVPLSKEEEKKQKIAVTNTKQHINVNVSIIPQPDPSIYLRLKANDSKPNPKPKTCPKCGHKEKNHLKNKKKKYIENESWIDITAWKILGRFFKLDSQKLTELIKNDGPSMFSFVKVIYFLLKDNSLCEQSLNNIAHLLDTCLKDILVRDPEPDESNPHPKLIPTLFMDENGNVFENLSPFQKSAKPKGTNSDARGRGNRTTKNQQPEPPELNGLPKYFGTKILIAYLASILSNKVTRNHVDLTIFNQALVDVLSLPLEELKHKLGTKNYSFYVDHLTESLLTHISFGNDIKKIEWSSPFINTTFEAFFNLFSCDATHHYSLECVNKYILSFSDVAQRNGIISSFTSALTNNKLNYTLHTRTRVVTWCLDPRYVGFSLPQYSLDFIKHLSEDEKLHLDIRRAIASVSVAHFKLSCLVDAEPQQFEVLYDILKAIYKTSVNNLAPTFCQLVCPKYCQTLSKQSPLYKALLPDKSLPETFVTPFEFGRISMPKTGAWKGPHEQFVSTFIGEAILSKDENVLQLAIQILNKLRIRGGETAQKIAPFIITAFNEFNVHVSSAILLDFIFNFCLVEEHQAFDGLIDGFVSIFKKTKDEIQRVNETQMVNYWTAKNKFQVSSYSSLERICGIFIGCLQNTLSKIEKKQDFLVANSFAKKVLKVLDEGNVFMYYEPYRKLRNIFAIVSNDNLTNSLSSDPSEQSLINLIKFMREASSLLSNNDAIPQFLKTCLEQNYKFVNLDIIRSFSDFPVEVAQNQFVRALVKALVSQYTSKPENKNDDFFNTIPELEKFAYIPSNTISASQFNSMVLNAMTSQMAHPMAMRAADPDWM